MAELTDLKKLKQIIYNHYPKGSPIREIILAEPDIILKERMKELIPILIRLERMS